MDMTLAEMPPRLQERVICSVSAASVYQIPADVLLAVAEKEGGRPGQWVKNSNGTYDIGVMQFNTAYLTDLSRHGIRVEHVAAPGCYPYKLAAWRLRMHIKNDRGDLWTRAANYHSRTPIYNSTYRADLIKRAHRWGAWLRQNYPDLQSWQVSPEPAQNSTALRQQVAQTTDVTTVQNSVQPSMGSDQAPARFNTGVSRGLIR